MKHLMLCRWLAAVMGACSLMTISATNGLPLRNVPLDVERLEQAHLVKGTRDGGGEYWLADGRSFIHVQEELSETWGPNGLYHAVIKIDRFFGDEAEIQRQIALGTLPPTATLVLPNFDCDDKAIMDPYMPFLPEIDRVCLNGVELGHVSGENDSWATDLFEVPLSLLKLPSQPGDVCDNELEITVDIGNQYAIWVLFQLWQAIVIPSPDPLLLVHGWTPHQDALAVLQDTVRQTFGIPAELAVVEMENSPEDNALMLAEQLESLCGKYGVERFNILAHSKGGLDSRVLVDAEGLASDRVGRVMQIATPNAGSHLADIVVEPHGFWQNALVATLGRIPQAKVWVQDTAGVRSLTPAACAAFNAAYGRPACPVNVVAGSVRNMRWPFQKPCIDENGEERYNPRWNLMDWVSAWLSYDHDFDDPSDARHGDSIVSVASAHTAATPMPASPLVNWNLDYLHPRITDEGGPAVLDAYREMILAAGNAGGFMAGEGNAGMHIVGGAAKPPTRGGAAPSDGWKEGLPFTLTGEAECPAFGTVEIPLPKFSGGESPAQLALWGLPPLATAQLLLPDGTEVPLEGAAADTGAPEGFAVFLSGAAHAQVEACPDGILRLRVNARAALAKSRLFYTWGYAGQPRLLYHDEVREDGRLHLQAALEGAAPSEVTFLTEYAPCNASLLSPEADGVAWMALPEFPAAQHDGMDVALPLEPEQGYRVRLTARLHTAAGDALTLNRTAFVTGFTAKGARLESAAVDIGPFRREKSAFVTATFTVPEGADGDSYLFDGVLVNARDPSQALGEVAGRAVNVDGRLVFTGGIPMAGIEASLKAGDAVAFRQCRIRRRMGPLEVMVPVAAQNWSADETLATSRPLREEELFNRPLRLKETFFCEGGYRDGAPSPDGFDFLRIHLAFEDAAAMPQDETLVFHAQLLDSEREPVARCVAHVLNGRTVFGSPSGGGAGGLVFTVAADDLVCHAGKPPYELTNIYVVLDGVARFRFLQGSFPVDGFAASDFHASGLPPPDTPAFRPVHPADTDRDYEIQPAEVRAAWGRWQASKMLDSLFMNAIYLEGKGEYRYDRRKCVFRPVAE